MGGRAYRGGECMKDQRTITIGYDENTDKFTLVTDDFDSMAEMARAVAQINLHIIEVLTGKE